MASEITYAEVKFKNAPPAAVVEVPPEMKKHEHHPQKYPPWLPWLISVLLLLVCIALVAVLLVAPFFHSGDQPTALQQKFSELQCILEVLQGKEQGWICCPNGWKRFQKSCYYLSTDIMSWAESVQNCTGMGSQLVVINSKAEQAFLTTELQQFPKGTNYYIGLYAQEVGKWQWVDQTPLNEEAVFWRKGEPTKVDVENCTVIHVSSDTRNWNDSRCESHYRICEVAALNLTVRPSS
ncbi:C-type lectin domain family 4 member E-like isoform X1 [Rissa tridactyla]|uniref:C-type lectin domain family 4 member E-like isoform X1 n=2 Tax=Rissa tridactyla TaxID=75485 RepID=UPI0023BA98C5|nr:C-type lectin domain family 4 member E-like isoform X1 [Rissa tridactyla]XP_054045053.1 C-type lectin domain family 4 member E-like isoform X1 [Rissa tridactyla]XP_054045054.1 C-type lectin domain family 4 member E-like isoform X1 [Rissa tridactyla]XP_054045055.1 C-type lectin domain family 4 member E-like isoform X1 [Rissa tridactyla]